MSDNPRPTAYAVATFLDLKDTPDSYFGKAGHIPVVRGQQLVFEPAVLEASKDSRLYGRKNGEWVPINPSRVTTVNHKTGNVDIFGEGIRALPLGRVFDENIVLSSGKNGSLVTEQGYNALNISRAGSSLLIGDANLYTHLVASNGRAVTVQVNGVDKPVYSGHYPPKASDIDGIVEEAPKDNKAYARKNGNWSEVSAGSNIERFTQLKDTISSITGRNNQVLVVNADGDLIETKQLKAVDVAARPSSWVPSWGDVTGKPTDLVHDAADTEMYLRAKGSWKNITKGFALDETGVIYVQALRNDGDLRKTKAIYSPEQISAPVDLHLWQLGEPDTYLDIESILTSFHIRGTSYIGSWDMNDQEIKLIENMGGLVGIGGINDGNRLFLNTPDSTKWPVCINDHLAGEDYTIWHDGLDAPKDGKGYVRKNGAWATSDSVTAFKAMSDTPNDYGTANQAVITDGTKIVYKTLTASDVKARPDNWVPAWADITGKPAVPAKIADLTDVGAYSAAGQVPVVNAGKTALEFKTLTAADVKARPNNWVPNWNDIANRPAIATKMQELLDVPNYTGNAGKLAQVNTAENAIVWAKLTASDVGARPVTWVPDWNDIANKPNLVKKISDLSDVGAFTAGGQVAVVNVGGTAVEFRKLTAADTGARPDNWTPNWSQIGNKPTFVSALSDLSDVPAYTNKAGCLPFVNAGATAIEWKKVDWSHIDNKPTIIADTTETDPMVRVAGGWKALADGFTLGKEKPLSLVGFDGTKDTVFNVIKSTNKVLEGLPYYTIGDSKTPSIVAFQSIIKGMGLNHDAELSAYDNASRTNLIRQIKFLNGDLILGSGVNRTFISALDKAKPAQIHTLDAAKKEVFYDIWHDGMDAPDDGKQYVRKNKLWSSLALDFKALTDTPNNYGKAGQALVTTATGIEYKTLTASDVKARPDNWVPAWTDITGKPAVPAKIADLTDVGAYSAAGQVPVVNAGKTALEFKKLTAADIGARSSSWVPTWGDVTGKPTDLVHDAADTNLYLRSKGSWKDIAKGFALDETGAAHVMALRNDGDLRKTKAIYSPEQVSAPVDLHAWCLGEPNTYLDIESILTSFHIRGTSYIGSWDMNDQEMKLIENMGGLVGIGGINNGNRLFLNTPDSTKWPVCINDNASGENYTIWHDGLDAPKDGKDYARNNGAWKALDQLPKPPKEEGKRFVIVWNKTKSVYEWVEENVEIRPVLFVNNLLLEDSKTRALSGAMWSVKVEFKPHGLPAEGKDWHTLVASKDNTSKLALHKERNKIAFSVGGANGIQNKVVTLRNAVHRYSWARIELRAAGSAGLELVINGDVVHRESTGNDTFTSEVFAKSADGAAHGALDLIELTKANNDPINSAYDFAEGCSNITIDRMDPSTNHIFLGGKQGINWYWINPTSIPIDDTPYPKPDLSLTGGAIVPESKRHHLRLGSHYEFKTWLSETPLLAPNYTLLSGAVHNDDGSLKHTYNVYIEADRQTVVIGYNDGSGSAHKYVLSEPLKANQWLTVNMMKVNGDKKQGIIILSLNGITVTAFNTGGAATADKEEYRITSIGSEEAAKANAMRVKLINYNVFVGDADRRESAQCAVDEGAGTTLFDTTKQSRFTVTGTYDWIK